MKDLDMENIVVKKDDTLIITINDDTVDADTVEQLKNKMLKMRPDLDGRLMIISGRVQLGVIKDASESKRSMKGVF